MNDFFFLMKQELALAVLIFVLLFARLRPVQIRSEKLLAIINVLLLANLALGFFRIPSGNLFGDMFVTGTLQAFEKNLLNLGLWIISLQSWQWLKNHAHIAEFYMLLLSTVLGMFLMISSNNLLMFYLALELSTIPLAALANFNLGERRSAEAAFKMIVSSAFSSGLLLFGISLAYGAAGTLNFDTVARAWTGTPLGTLSFVLMLSGFAFKISAVPFHLWTADVYEGSPVAVTSHLSVMSKGAVVFVIVAALYRLFSGIPGLVYYSLMILSVLSMIIGNLFALRQQNMKRFLAFSSIAQIGFILVGLAGNVPEGNTSVVFFVLVYIFSNLGAFGVVSLISATTGRENLDDYRGLNRTNPGLSWVLALSLFSLAGIPPTAGFFGKFFLLMTGAGTGNYLWVTIAALNMVVSLYYYLNVIRVMFMEKNDQALEKIRVGWSPRLAMVICVGGILVSGVVSGGYQYIYSLFYH